MTTYEYRLTTLTKYITTILVLKLYLMTAGADGDVGLGRWPSSFFRVNRSGEGMDILVLEQKLQDPYG